MRRWWQDKPRPRRSDQRETARFNLRTARLAGSVPDSGIRVAVRSGVPIGEVAQLTGKTEKEVQQIMEASQPQQNRGPEVQQSAPPPQDAEATPEETYSDDEVTQDGYSQEDLLAALFTPDEIGRKAGEARARGDVHSAGILDQFHADAVERQEERSERERQEREDRG